MTSSYQSGSPSANYTNSRVRTFTPIRISTFGTQGTHTSVRPLIKLFQTHSAILLLNAHSGNSAIEYEKLLQHTG